MRTNLLFSAMAFAALAFAGCSQDDTFSASPAANQLIGFGTYVGRDAVSRASVATEESVKQNHFGVFAYDTKGQEFYTATPTITANTKPDFMDNEEVLWMFLQEEWDYRPGKYWPNDPNEKLSFFAYSPYNANVGYTVGAAKNNTLIPFTVGANIKAQQDLLYAKVVDQTFNNTVDKSGKVKFNFQHALSRISLAVKCTNLWLDAKVYIEKVMLTGSGATYDKTSKNWTLSNNVFYTTGDLDLISDVKDKIDWKNCDGQQSFTWDFSSSPHVVDRTSVSPYDLTGSDGYLMVIPQQFDAQKLYVCVQYRVETPRTVTGVNDNVISTEKVTDSYYVTTCVNPTGPLEFKYNTAYRLVLDLKLEWVDCQLGTVNGWPTPSDTEVPQSSAQKQN